MADTKVTAAEMLSGQVRMRQGGDTNGFTTPGTTNYEWWAVGRRPVS